ncbi:MAG TPA: DUF2723 domain-containing protein, partial [Candidatus Baltobacteraceae bacterium]
MTARLGWLAFSVALVVYVLSLSPNVNFWDTGEMQTVPYMLGIAHPTGFPLFILAGWLFSHVVPFGTVAWRLGALSAIALALAARAVYVLGMELGASPGTAFCGALLYALGPVVWMHGSRAEVHDFVALFSLLAITSAVRFRRSGQAPALRATALFFG